MSTDHVTRRHVVEELVKTERDYVNMLFKLTDNVIAPIRAALFPDQAQEGGGGGGGSGGNAVRASKFISPEDFDTIFQGCTLVLEANKNFFPQVAQKLTQWSESQTIGDVFVEWSHYFKLYKFYCNHFDTATHVFSAAVNRSKKFAEFIDDAMPRMNFQTVQSIMISPIQRIPRYLLLLKELVRHTGVEHPDAALLAQALGNMSSTAAALDRSLSVQESALELFCVVTKFRPIPELEQPTPGLVRVGTVDEETTGPKGVTLVLLKDATLLLGSHGSAGKQSASSAEKARRQYAYLGSLKVVRAFMGLPKNAESIVGAAKFEEHVANATTDTRFTVQARPRSYIFRAATREEAQQWVDAIAATTARPTGRLGSAGGAAIDEEAVGPVWEEDNASKGRCRVCDRGFNMSVRRHHCRYCGLVACDKCTSTRMFIANLGYVEGRAAKGGERVCRKCTSTVVLENSNVADHVRSLERDASGSAVRTKTESLSPRGESIARRGGSSADLFPKFWLAALGDELEGGGLDELETPTVARRRVGRVKQTDLSLFDTPSTTPTAASSASSAAARATDAAARALAKSPESSGSGGGGGSSGRSTPSAAGVAATAAVFTPGERAVIPGLPTPEPAVAAGTAAAGDALLGKKIPRGPYSRQSDGWSDDSSN